LWNRQVAKHGSVLALAIGALASVLGVPLAPEQISAIIYAASIVMYVASQVRGLWKPETPKADTVRLSPLVKVLLAAVLVGELVAAHPARADQSITFIWPAVTTGVDDLPLSADNAVDRYGLGCSHTEAEVIAAEGDETKYVYVEGTAGLSLTHVFAPGDWFCLLYAHNATGWSSRSNTLMFTVNAPKREPKAPVLSRK
jgi:hypothetical protein